MKRNAQRFVPALLVLTASPAVLAHPGRAAIRRAAWLPRMFGAAVGLAGIWLLAA